MQKKFYTRRFCSRSYPHTIDDTNSFLRSLSNPGFLFHTLPTNKHYTLFYFRAKALRIVTHDGLSFLQRKRSHPHKSTQLSRLLCTRRLKRTSPFYRSFFSLPIRRSCAGRNVGNGVEWKTVVRNLVFLSFL